MLVALLGLVLFVVYSALSTQGMILLACKNNFSAVQSYLYNLVNSMTFGLFGILKFASLRTLRFQTVGNA